MYDAHWHSAHVQCTLTIRHITEYNNTIIVIGGILLAWYSVRIGSEYCNLYNDTGQLNCIHFLETLLVCVICENVCIQLVSMGSCTICWSLYIEKKKKNYYLVYSI